MGDELLAAAVLAQVVDFLNPAERQALAQTSHYTNSALLSREILNGLDDARDHTTFARLQLLRVESLIHTGSAGRCFHVSERASKKSFALKIVRSSNLKGVKYFILRDLAAMKTLSHPNIVPLLHADMHNSTLYSMYPYVPLSLAKVLLQQQKQKQPLPRPLARKWMIQLLEALEHCHQRHVLHRNIKPKHLLLRFRDATCASDGLDGADLCLSGFELARTSCGNSRSLTAEVVTLWYRPPEVLLGGRQYDGRLDMWSAGCVFAEILTTEHLFPASNTLDLLFMIFQRLGTPDEDSWPGVTQLPHYSSVFPEFPLRPISATVKGAGPPDRELLDGCLQLCPAKRFTARKAVELAWRTRLTDASMTTSSEGTLGDVDLSGILAPADCSPVAKMRWTIQAPRLAHAVAAESRLLSRLSLRNRLDGVAVSMPRALALHMVSSALKELREPASSCATALAQLLFDAGMLAPTGMLRRCQAYPAGHPVQTLVCALAASWLAVKLQAVTFGDLVAASVRMKAAFDNEAWPADLSVQSFLRETRAREENLLRLLEFDLDLETPTSYAHMLAHGLSQQTRTMLETSPLRTPLWKSARRAQLSLLGRADLVAVPVAIFFATWTHAALEGETQVARTDVRESFQREMGLLVSSQVERVLATLLDHYRAAAPEMANEVAIDSRVLRHEIADRHAGEKAMAALLAHFEQLRPYGQE